jgi:hypothetical protein
VKQMITIPKGAQILNTRTGTWHITMSLSSHAATAGTSGMWYFDHGDDRYGVQDKDVRVVEARPA